MKNVFASGDELYTEDVFWVLFDYEVTRSQRYPAPLCLLQIETTPHADGSYLVPSAAVFNSVLNSHLRSADISTGNGKSYRILLPTTDEYGGRAVCERLISICQNKIQTIEGGFVSFSLNIGLTYHPGGQALSKEQLLEQAESALQNSKTKGPNTYTAYSDLHKGE